MSNELTPALDEPIDDDYTMPDMRPNMVDENRDDLDDGDEKILENATEDMFDANLRRQR